MRQARANQYNISKPPGSTNNASNGSNNSFFEDNNIFGRKGQQQQQQTQMQEEVDLQALEEQERAIRELEVCKTKHNKKSLHLYTIFFNLLNRKILWASMKSTKNWDPWFTSKVLWWTP